MRPQRLAQLFLIFLALPAIASEGTSLSAIAEAARHSGDRSRQALVSVFGEVVNDPLAATGGGDTVLASLFQITNAALLVVGALFATYVGFRNLTKIAHDGALFDREQHTLWAPVRLVWGVISLVPTKNGWALCQLLMLWAASLMGVGIANMATDSALMAYKDGKDMVVQPAMPSTISIAQSIYELNLCMHGINAGLSATASEGGFEFPDEYVQDFRIPNGFILRNRAGTKVCGGATVAPELLEARPVSTSWFGPSVDASPIYKAHASALLAMQTTLREDALKFTNAVVEYAEGASTALPDPNLAITHAALEYESTVRSAARTQMKDASVLTDELNNRIKDAGWWSLGAWYQTFAAANSTLSDAVAGKAQINGESLVGDTGTAAIRNSIAKAYKTKQASNSATSPLGGMASTGATDTGKFVGSIFSAPGQRLLAYLTSPDFGEAGVGTTNPLIKMKNIGDYTLMTAEVATGAYVALNAALAAAKGTLAGHAVDLSTGAGSFAQAAINAIQPFFWMIVLPLYLLGAALSVYLPLAPFIVWFGAIINWLVVVLEAIVAAPLWAIAHLDGQGEGMGSRSAHGYLFLLNLIARPFLMVVGFFGGGACLVVGGTFLNQIFGVAVANVQLNSFTGLVSLLGFLYIYFSIGANLVHRCFGLVFIVPDQVINWVGGAVSSHLGRDTNESVSSSVNILLNRLDHMHKSPFTPISGNKDKPGDGIKR
ncbi:DotA/TraY family protein [Massilia sp. NR 4-1]|uniref:DotA/TraY family protein n=1 Tax=Massilia sp. NR 4-1 TaxID=1678028 RepID=UPI00067C571A|nr:DotA/TraY family protein [Massilia sp. NR 4-1]AKU21211.1 hypothetical protein ACZ75_06680 [Massilia sp. NR 4-1]